MGGYAVAPFAGAWIEILKAGDTVTNVKVAPFAGAWIEIVSFVTSQPI